jgi:hypothetical protein
MSSKICAHVMETPTICHNYHICHKIGFACIRLRVWTWSLSRRGFYAIIMNYLRYFCERFTQFAQKKNCNLWLASHTGERGGFSV